MAVLYYNGSIVPMSEEGKIYEALVADDGRIQAVGTLCDLREEYPDAESFDLNGAALLPGFFDAHSHFSGVAYSFLQISMEECRSFDDIRKAVASFIENTKPEDGTWLVARDFDMANLAEKDLPPLDFLDEISDGYPLVISHKSGHTGFFNSKALDMLGVTPETVPPSGGTIGVSSGKLTGYMEENAFLYYLQQVPTPPESALVDAYKRAGELYASYGITTVQEGMMTGALVALYKRLTQEQVLFTDTVGYAGKNEYENARAVFDSEDYQNSFRLGGMKLFLDGSPQAKTAHLRDPYENTDSCGISTMTDKKLYEALRYAYDNRLQVLVHCNGDKAADRFLDTLAVLEAEGCPLRPYRPVMIHAQLLAPDRMKDVRALGVIPSFFPIHIYHYGALHQKQLGRKRAQRLSPANAALKEHIPFTLHTDSPVFLPDMMASVSAAVNRVTKNGKVLGEEYKIPVFEALCAITKYAAYQSFEETTKGTLFPGKLADFVILSENPLQTAPQNLAKVQVLYTIKEGNVVYRHSST